MKNTLKNHHKTMYNICLLSVIFLLVIDSVFAIDVIDRRRDQYTDEFSYFVYPIPAQIPGLGSAFGVGATVSNIAETDIDITGFFVDGDFSASGLTVLNMHIIPESLIFDLGLYDYNINIKQFNRGINSDRNEFILPEVKGNGMLGQLKWTQFDKKLDFFARYGVTSSRVLSVLDKNYNEFSNFDKSKKTNSALTLGVTLDLTDDSQDPRKGVRFEASRWQQLNNAAALSSSYHVYDANLSVYVPIAGKNTLAFNYFRSQAVIDSMGSTNFSDLQSKYGLVCSGIPDPTERSKCEATESKLINEMIATNRYGNAGSLGGTQRLRSFSNGRFRAGHSVFYGVEYRWNLTDENTPTDWVLIKGQRTNYQVSFFAEAGGVADDVSQLNNNLKYSYGTGFRMLFRGVTIRADLATGSEGTEFQLFLDYPWSMFSIDSGR